MEGGREGTVGGGCIQLTGLLFAWFYRYRTDGGHFPYAEGYH